MRTFCSEGPHGAVYDALVGCVEGSHLEHLRLVLDEQLDTLDRSGRRLRDDRSNATEGEALREPEFLARLTHLKQKETPSLI